MAIEDRLFQRHAGKSILLDSNLLLVFLTGYFDEQLLGRFKRVSAYSIQDYRILVRLLRSFRVLMTTPHVLTEVGNLANHLPEDVRKEWNRSFGALLLAQDRFPYFLERWVPAGQLAVMTEFAAFGIADASLRLLASEALVVTEDFRLSGVLRQQGLPVLNFQDIRKLAEGMNFGRE